MFAFRLVVRGTNTEGVRVRRVRTIEADSYEAAWLAFEAEQKAMAKGLDDLHLSVYPPVGWKLDGTLSRGFEVA